MKFLSSLQRYSFLNIAFESNRRIKPAPSGPTHQNHNNTERALTVSPIDHFTEISSPKIDFSFDFHGCLALGTVTVSRNYRHSLERSSQASNVSTEQPRQTASDEKIQGFWELRKFNNRCLSPSPQSVSCLIASQQQQKPTTPKPCQPKITFGRVENKKSPSITPQNQIRQLSKKMHGKPIDHYTRGKVKQSIFINVWFIS